MGRRPHRQLPCHLLSCRSPTGRIRRLGSCSVRGTLAAGSVSRNLLGDEIRFVARPTGIHSTQSHAGRVGRVLPLPRAKSSAISCPKRLRGSELMRVSAVLCPGSRFRAIAIRRVRWRVRKKIDGFSRISSSSVQVEVAGKVVRQRKFRSIAKMLRCVNWLFQSSAI